MTVVLRDYQTRAVGEVRDAFLNGHDSVLLQLPTGAGKTVVSGHILGSAVAKGNASMFICNRVELVEQTALTFDRLGLRYGIIAAGFTGNPREALQIASVDTLKSRLKKPAEAAKIRIPKLRAYDECRAMGSKGWSEVFAYFRAHGGKDLGLDATPKRLDGKGLDQYFTRMVMGPQYSELMRLGALVPFDVYGPSAPDLSGVRMKGGDYDQEQIESIFDKPQLVGEIAAHYLKLTPGKQGITFAVSRKHSEHLAESYRAAGVAAVHLDGDTDKGERKRVINAFRRGEIKVITNADLLTAGFDAPGVEVITMARPTASLAIYLQQCGRGSRPEPGIGKTHCVLLDHAGNWQRHGLPDADRTWSLEGRKPGERKKKDEDEGPMLRQCEACFKVYPPAPACPHCGAASKLSPREIKEVEGELQRVDAAQAARLVEQQKREVKKASSLDDLKTIERERGYKPGWAQATFSAKRKAAEAMAERRTRAQFEAYRR